MKMILKNCSLEFQTFQRPDVNITLDFSTVGYPYNDGRLNHVDTGENGYHKTSMIDISEYVSQGYTELSAYLKAFRASNGNTEIVFYDSSNNYITNSYINVEATDGTAAKPVWGYGNGSIPSNAKYMLVACCGPDFEPAFVKFLGNS